MIEEIVTTKTIPVCDLKNAFSISHKDVSSVRYSGTEDEVVSMLESRYPLSDEHESSYTYRVISDKSGGFRAQIRANVSCGKETFDTTLLFLDNRGAPEMVGLNVRIRHD